MTYLSPHILPHLPTLNSLSQVISLQRQRTRDVPGRTRLGWGLSSGLGFPEDTLPSGKRPTPSNMFLSMFSSTDIQELCVLVRVKVPGSSQPCPGCRPRMALEDSIQQAQALDSCLPASVLVTLILRCLTGLPVATSFCEGLRHSGVVPIFADPTEPPHHD